MSIDIDKAIEKVNEYINEVNRLINLQNTTEDRKKGVEEKNELYTKISRFVLKVDKGRINSYYEILEKDSPMGSVLYRTVYTHGLQSVKLFLISIKEDLELQRDFSVKSKKLDKIEKEIKELEAEAKRRELVVETKGWGSIIEVIQMLRDELKNRQDAQTDIREIKGYFNELKEEIKEIKDLLKKKTH